MNGVNVGRRKCAAAGAHPPGSDQWRRSPMPRSARCGRPDQAPKGRLRTRQVLRTHRPARHVGALLWRYSRAPQPFRPWAVDVGVHVGCLSRAVAALAEPPQAGEEWF